VFPRIEKKATKCHVYFSRAWDCGRGTVKKDFTFCLQDTGTIFNAFL